VHVAVIGTGYVGLVLGACLADTGNDVVCADLSEEKVAGLQQNRLPIFEPGLDSIVERNQRAGRLTFTTDVASAVRKSQFIFIAVGTPADEDGSADLSYVLAAARTIAESAQREVVVVTKSTVPVGTAEMIREILAEHASVPFHVCSNPEFLKEGAAVDDFKHPDRVIVGADSQRARELMEELYEPYIRSGKPLIFMDLASAELTKYAANAMLATRISFMNEMALMCEATGANVDLVRLGLGSDPRIGPLFLLPGPGFGGSCFPKDVRALSRTADDHGVSLKVLSGVHAANERQKLRAAEKARALVGGSFAGRTVAVWGLAFKAQTDDMRESPALTLIDAVLREGGKVVAHDPEAGHEARRRLGMSVTLVDSPYQACQDADVLVVMTEWNEYRSPDWARVQSALVSPALVDMRNLYSPTRMRALGFRYDSVGRPR
jgi:UDPglucose 6-dehydrogenase